MFHLGFCLDVKKNIGHVIHRLYYAFFYAFATMAASKLNPIKFNQMAKSKAMQMKGRIPMTPDIKNAMQDLEEDLQTFMALPNESKTVWRKADPIVRKYIPDILACDDKLLRDGKLPLIPDDLLKIIQPFWINMPAHEKNPWWSDIADLMEEGTWITAEQATEMRKKIDTQFPKKVEPIESKVESFNEIKTRTDEDVSGPKASTPSSSEAIQEEWSREMNQIENMTTDELGAWFEREASLALDEKEKLKTQRGADGAVWNEDEEDADDDDDDTENKEDDSKTASTKKPEKFSQVVAIFNRRLFEFVKDLKVSREKMFPILGDLFTKIHQYLKSNPMSQEPLKQFREAEALFVREYMTTTESKMKLMEQMELHDYAERIDSFLSEGIVRELNEFQAPYIVASFVQDPNRLSYQNFQKSLRTLRQAAEVCIRMETKLAPIGSLVNKTLQNLGIRPGQPIQAKHLSKTKVANQVFRTFSKNQNKLKDLYTQFESKEERSGARDMVALAMPGMLKPFDDLDRKIDAEKAKQDRAATAASKANSKAAAKSDR